MRGLISFDLGAAKATLLGSRNDAFSLHAPRQNEMSLYQLYGPIAFLHVIEFTAFS